MSDVLRVGSRVGNALILTTQNIIPYFQNKRVAVSSVDISKELKIDDVITLKRSQHRTSLLEVVGHTSDWGGIQLKNDSNTHAWNLMTNNDSFGIYDDTSDKWHLRAYHDSKLVLFHNGSPRAETNNEGFDVIGGLGISQTAGTGLGLSLYGGAVSGKPGYGMFFAGTSQYGRHGGVQGTWATYFTMAGESNRGWIFQHLENSVASISGDGSARFDGSLFIKSDITTDGNIYLTGDGIIRLGSGTSQSDHGFIHWTGTSNAGQLRIATSDDNGSEPIVFGDYDTSSVSSTFTEWGRIYRDNFRMRTHYNEFYVTDSGVNTFRFGESNSGGYGLSLNWDGGHKLSFASRHNAIDTTIFDFNTSVTNQVRFARSIRFTEPLDGLYWSAGEGTVRATNGISGDWSFLRRNSATNQLEIGSDNYIDWYESDEMTKVYEMEMNSGNFTMLKGSLNINNGDLLVSNNGVINGQLSVGNGIHSNNGSNLYMDSNGTSDDTGDIIFRTGTHVVKGRLVQSNGDISWAGSSGTPYEIYHQGNDGSGSGLDADLLDGQNGNYYQSPYYSHTKTIRVNGDADKFYPVIFHGPFLGWGEYVIYRLYSATAPSQWNNSTHKGGLTLSIQASGDSTWGGNTKHYTVNKFTESYSKMCAGLQKTVSGAFIIWLRGGGADYMIRTPNGTSQGTTIYYSDYEAADETMYPVRQLTDGDFDDRVTNEIKNKGLKVDGGHVSPTFIDLLGSMDIAADGKLKFATNSTFFGTLNVGGNGYTSARAANVASVTTTNGNLHLDSGKDRTTFINYYSGTGGVQFGDGDGNIVAALGADGNLWKGNGANNGHRFYHQGNDGSGSGLDADLWDGKQLRDILPFNSISDFPHGTHVITDLPFSSGASILFEISGKGYGTNSFKIIGEAYLYNNTFYSASITDLSGSFTQSMVMHSDSSGNVCLWWPRMGYWQSFSVTLRTVSDPSDHNYVTAIENSPKPSTSSANYTEVGVTRSWTSGNDGVGSGLDADLLDGYQSGTKGSNVVLRTESNGYLGLDSWVRVSNTGGLFSSDGHHVQFSDNGYELVSNDDNLMDLTLKGKAGAALGYLAGDSAVGVVVRHYDRSEALRMPRNKGSMTRNGLHTIWDSGNDGAGSGLDADLLGGINSNRYSRRHDKKVGTAGPGWMSVARASGGRYWGTITVNDNTSGDHAYIRLHWTRSYIDSNVTVLSTGGHARNITHVRVIRDSDLTYGDAILQVHVEDTSSFEVNSYREGDDGRFSIPEVLTPTIENSKSGYSTYGSTLSNLDDYSMGSTRGFVAGGNLLFTGTPTTTSQDRGIIWNGFDKDGTSDYSDAASIKHVTNTGGFVGSVLEITSMNDAGDGIAFTTASNYGVRHNGNAVWNAGNDGSGSGLDADLWDGHQFSSYLNQSVKTDASPTFNNLQLNGDLKMVGTDSMIWTPNTSSGYTGFYDPYNAKYVLRYTNGVGFGFGGDPSPGNVIRIRDSWMGHVQSDVKIHANTNGEMLILGTATDTDKWISMGNIGDNSWWRIKFRGSTNGTGGNEIGFESNWTGNSLYLDHDGNLENTRSGSVYKVWDSGNDGSGSGLDADLWDGHQFSNYLNQGVRSIDRVRFLGTGNDYHQGGVELQGNGNSDTIKPSLGFHQPGQYAGSLKLDGNGFHVMRQGAAIRHKFYAESLIADNSVLVGSAATSKDTVIRVLSDNSHTAGFEAYGADQGTGYLYVGQSPSHGGGVSYNGDGTPSFASGEESDEICFYRRTGDVNTAVFGYKHDSNVVTFRTTPKVNAYIVYHQGNDGPGSGLDADTVDGMQASSLLKSNSDDNFIGKLSVATTNHRSAGMYGIYDSDRIAHIWSMGTAYTIPDNGSTFGNLYGFAYKHTNNATGGTMAGGHQAVWCTNGSPKVALGESGVWTSGVLTELSDRRNKTNLKIIDDPIERIKQVNGYTYDRIDRPELGRLAGVMAQEILKVLPEVVQGSEAEGDNLTVSYGNLAGLFIEVDKAQQARIESLESEVFELKKMINTLMKR